MFVCINSVELEHLNQYNRISQTFCGKVNYIRQLKMSYFGLDINFFQFSIKYIVRKLGTTNNIKYKLYIR